MSNSLPKLFKLVGNYNPDPFQSWETSIVVDQTGVINSGKPITITFKCADDNVWPPSPSNLPTLIIRDYFTRTVLNTVTWPNGGYRGFAVKNTINGLIHIFGTHDQANTAGQNSIVHSTIDATLIPTAAIEIFNSEQYGSGIQCIASYVSPTPTGYCLNYANQWGAGFLDWPDANFTPGAKSQSNPNGYTVSSSAQAWTTTLESAAADYNAADGYWYSAAQNLQNGLLWLTMGRSQDRVHWTYPSTILIYPDMPALEGIDSSDIRMVEYNGQVYIVHLCGDQSTWSNIRTAVYPGTLQQLYAEFFP